MTTTMKLEAVMRSEARCKAAETCPRLKIRELYFEPNPHTEVWWRKERGFYKKGVDRRVVFVAESPSGAWGNAKEAHFTVAGQKGLRNWAATGRDERFTQFRIKYGFQDCLMTDAVKCGAPSTPAQINGKEAAACSKFLRQELEILRPTVVACLGGEAMRLFIEHTLPYLSFSPVPIRLHHYSYRGTLKELNARWQTQVNRIRAALKARGVSATHPEFTR